MATLQDKLDAERKQDLAWRLHLAGATPQEIAGSKDPDRAGFLFQDARGAAQALRAARRRYEADEAEAEEAPTKRTSDMVKTDLATLRRLKRALWPKATAGDVAAAREIRQITLAAAQLAGYAKGQTQDELPKVGDPVDDLAKKRDARRAAGS